LYASTTAEDLLRSTVIIGHLLDEVTVQEAVSSMTTEIVRMAEIQPESSPSINGCSNQVLLSIRTSDHDQPKSILLRFFTSERALITALIIGQVDYALLENDQSVAEIVRSVPKMKVPWSYLPSYTVRMMCYNCERALFNHRDVRRALSFAIDKRGLISKMLADKADMVDGPLNRKSNLHPAGMTMYDYNPQQALKLLADQGWQDTNGDNILDQNGRPFTFSLIFSQGIILDESTVRWIKINLNEIGIDVHPVPLNREQLNTRLASRDFDAVLLQHRFLEGMESLEDFFSAGSSRSFISWQSHSLRQYISVYLRTGDLEQKKLMFQAAQKLINREQPVTFLYSKWIRYHVINSSKFTDFVDSEGRVKPVEKWRTIIKDYDSTLKNMRIRK